MQTFRTALIVAAIGFAAVMASYFARQSIADAQVAPSLDAGTVTTDIATAPVATPAESLPPAPVVAAPDPTTDPGGFVDDVRDQWRSGAYAGAVLLALYGLLYLVQKRRPAWLSGRTAFYTAVAMTFLTACAEAVARGSTPNFNVIIGAAAVAIGILIKGPTKKEPIA